MVAVMCGIGGIVSAKPLNSSSVCSVMMNQMKHRGPDDYGVFQWRSGSGPILGKNLDPEYESQISLIHCRLAVLDVSPRGWQPMASTGGEKVLVYNGEIYNYLELRSELAARGYVFSSQTDTEVLLNAFDAWGPACVHRLEGMFAFALVDLVGERIFLARDHFGIKPLYYQSSNDRFCFASELGALLAASPTKSRANLQSVYDYLHFGLVGHRPESFFKDILELPAAHYMEMSLHDPTILKQTRYWHVPNEKIDISIRDAAHEVRGRFLQNVERHLRSDRRVGAAVSGGIDSSSILMCMRHVAGKELDLQGVSFVASDYRLSEENWVDIVARKAGAEVHKVRIRAQELVEDLPELTRSQGEPFLSTSIYAQYRVFREASRRDLTVMLDGQGADELFAGYVPFLGYRMQSLVRSGEWLRALELLRMARLTGERSTPYWIAHALWGLVPSMKQKAARLLADYWTVPNWLDIAWFREQGVSVVRPAEVQYSEGLAQALRRGIESISLPSLLRHEDRNSMAHSVESRVPFLTPGFVEFVLALPEDHLIGDDATTKRVFRLAMEGIVPPVILQRKDKIGFRTPEQKWIRELSGWIDSEISSGRLATLPGLNHQGVEREWEVCKKSGSPSTSVWRWISLAAWRHEFDVAFS